MDTLTDLFAQAQQWLFETVVQPLAVWAGLSNILEVAYEGTGWLLVGGIQIVVMLVLIGPLQRGWPIAPVQDPAAVRVDVLYTLLHRLGLFKLAMYFSVDAVFEQGLGWLRAQGLPTWHLDALWPGVTDQALISFLIYLVAFDFVNYWLHRAQHQWGPWWALKHGWIEVEPLRNKPLQRFTGTARCPRRKFSFTKCAAEAERGAS